MKVTWTKTYSTDFDDWWIEEICDDIYKNGWDYDTVHTMIEEKVACLDDAIYFTWDEDETQAIMTEIKRRVGGVQISMFDKEESK